jgi:putative nucleotidyltransferase with HDIG domain
MDMQCDVRLSLVAERRTDRASDASTYGSLVLTWLVALERRDPGTVGHARRVTALALRLARRMRRSPQRLGQLRLGALLHDLGKLMVPDGILRNSSSLTHEELAVIRQHPGYGLQLLRPMTDFGTVLDVVYAHHERWDGAGYPLGLAGDRIPWSARLVALADVWDALRSDRPYRPAWTAQRAYRYVQDEAGRHFDPEVVEAFMGIPRSFARN